MVKRSTLSIRYVKELTISLQISQRLYNYSAGDFDVADDILHVFTGEAYKSLLSLNTRKASGPDVI